MLTEKHIEAGSQARSALEEAAAANLTKERTAAIGWTEERLDALTELLRDTWHCPSCVQGFGSYRCLPERALDRWLPDGLT